MTKQPNFETCRHGCPCGPCGPCGKNHQLGMSFEIVSRVVTFPYHPPIVGDSSMVAFLISVFPNMGDILNIHPKHPKPTSFHAKNDLILDHTLW